MRYLLIIALLSISFNAVAAVDECRLIKQAVESFRNANAALLAAAEEEKANCMKKYGQEAEESKVVKEEISAVVHFLSDVDTNMNALVENTRHLISVSAKRIAEVSNSASD